MKYYPFKNIDHSCILFNKSSRVAQLEKKLDGIDSLLQQQKSGNPQDASSGYSTLVANDNTPS